MIDTSTYKSTKSNPLRLSPVLDIFVLADGSQLTVLGEVEYEGRIGYDYYPMTTIVAELGDNAALLGLDFMESNDVILRLSTGKLMVGDETINLHREHAEKGCYRISLCETLTILSRSCGWLRWMCTLEKLPANLTRGERIALWNVYPLLLNLQG